MSLPIENLQLGLFDVPVLVGGLFAKPTDRYRLFRQHLLPALRNCRPQLAQLYSQDNGRAAIEPVLLLGVTLLQFMEKVPDRKAAELLRLHLGWKYALDLDIGEQGFHPTSLVKFRQRLLEGGVERLGFDALYEALRRAGLIRKSSPQRLDSTHILGAVASMGRLELVRETIRLFLVDLDRQGALATLPDGDRLRERYLDCDIPWHRADHERLERGSKQAGEDALALLKWARFQPLDLGWSDRALLLERVFLEQYELAGPTPVRRRRTASRTMVNPHDPEVQWAAKDQDLSKQWEGYKAQLCETVDAAGATRKKGEPTAQFLTDVTTTEAVASDLEGRRQVEANQLAAGQDLPDELIADGAYITARELARAAETGRTLSGPARPPRGRKGCFEADRFEVDIDARQAVCPAGYTSCQCSRLEEAGSGKIHFRFEWGAPCDDCPLQAQCTTSKSGRRMLLVGEHHMYLQARRHQMQDEAYLESLHRRNAIEGTISEFVRLGGRRTRYRGLAKTRLANYFLGAAVNARRWLRLLAWQLADGPSDLDPDGGMGARIGDSRAHTSPSKRLLDACLRPCQAWRVCTTTALLCWQAA